MLLTGIAVICIATASASATVGDCNGSCDEIEFDLAKLTEDTNSTKNCWNRKSFKREGYCAYWTILDYG